MVEFALLSFVLYLVIAAVFTFGRALFVAQALPQTADVFAHGLARTPLRPGDTLADALANPTVRQTLFNEADLNLDITAASQHDGGLTLDQYLHAQGVPVIHRLLGPLMIVNAQEDGKTFLWYPGAVQDPASGHYFVQVLEGNGSGPPLQVPVVVSLGDATGTSPDPFPLTVTNGVAGGGLAGLRLNYAFQSASLTAITYTAPGGGTVNGIPVGVLGVENSFVQATGEAVDTANTLGGLYAGLDHLGQRQVGGMVARPFQRLISASAVYRREVFGQWAVVPVPVPVPVPVQE